MWDKKSPSMVVEEADPHQAAIVTIKENQAKMENQETILGVTRSRDEICTAQNWKR
jgi:hypothetical protein